MPSIKLRSDVGLPAPLVGPELLRLLHAIEDGEAPFSSFTIDADLSDLHLPDVGIVCVPVNLTLGTARGYHATDVSFAVQSRGHGSLFPTFAGTIHTDPQGLSDSTVWLKDTYTPPMGALGRALDQTILRDVAARTLSSFLESLVHTAEVEIRRRETDAQREQRFNR